MRARARWHGMPRASAFIRSFKQLPDCPLRSHSQYPHHLVVLVFEHVAVPHELPRDIESGVEAGDLAQMGNDGVLEASLPGLGREGLVHQLCRRRRYPFCVYDQGLPIDHLEHGLVEVNCVSVSGEVVDFPDFITENPVLTSGLRVPAKANPDTKSLDSQGTLRHGCARRNT